MRGTLQRDQVGGRTASSDHLGLRDDPRRSGDRTDQRRVRVQLGQTVEQMLHRRNRDRRRLVCRLDRSLVDPDPASSRLCIADKPARQNVLRQSPCSQRPPRAGHPFAHLERLLGRCQPERQLGSPGADERSVEQQVQVAVVGDVLAELFADLLSDLGVKQSGLLLPWGLVPGGKRSRNVPDVLGERLGESNDRVLRPEGHLVRNLVSGKTGELGVDAGSERLRRLDETGHDAGGHGEFVLCVPDPCRERVQSRNVWLANACPGELRFLPGRQARESLG